MMSAVKRTEVSHGLQTARLRLAPTTEPGMANCSRYQIDGEECEDRSFTRTHNGSDRDQHPCES